jgi:hypothetical protein
MLCETPDIGELTGRIGRDFELAGLLDRRLSCPRRLDGACQQARVLAGPCRRFGYIGGDVRKRAATCQASRHRAIAIGVFDLTFDNAAHGAAALADFDARAKRFIEVRPHRALGVGPRKRVAGATLGDERLLAFDQVGFGVLDARATGGAKQRETRPYERSPTSRK